MKYITALFLSVTLSLSVLAQNTGKLQRPRLVVGIMVDQMRWDYLYRFYDRYGAGGLKRMMGEGFSCENTMIPYAQTVTAAGHTCVYTGSVPAIHGIMGNEWFDRSLGHSVYCTEDESVSTIGGSEKAAPQSPHNLWTTTICDELKLATNFRSKVIGIAIKDRGGILPAGHAADAAYWYDAPSGNWVTSTYYMKELPGWVTSFNQRKVVDSFYRFNWNTLYPRNTYVQSDKDDVPYEGKFGHETKPVFPHEFSSFIGKNYIPIASSPYGNTLTLAFAKTAVTAEGMGKDEITDFLAVSLSSPDYIGHQFGPNSIEEEDTYLRMDKDIESFLSFLDARVGKGNYTVFLTADHAVAHVPEFLLEHKIPAGRSSYSLAGLQTELENKFGIKNLVQNSSNYQIYLDDKKMDSAGADKEPIKKFIINWLNKNDNILIAFDTEEISEVNLPQEVKDMFINGYNTKLGGDIQVVLKPAFLGGGRTGTSHGTWYPYDSHIPLLWMGWGIKKGSSTRTCHMTDIAPTLAALLHIQMPNGSIGKPISEVIK